MIGLESYFLIPPDNAKTYRFVDHQVARMKEVR